MMFTWLKQLIGIRLYIFTTLVQVSSKSNFWYYYLYSCPRLPWRYQLPGDDLINFFKQGLVNVKFPPYLLDVKLRGVEISFSSNLSLVITHDYPWLPMITHDYPWLPMDFFYGHIGTVTRFYVEKLLSLSPVPWQLVSPK